MGVIRDCGRLGVHVPNKELGLDARKAGKSNLRIIKSIIDGYTDIEGHLRAIFSCGLRALTEAKRAETATREKVLVKRMMND